MSVARLVRDARAVRLEAEACSRLDDALPCIASDAGVCDLAECPVGTDVVWVRVRVLERRVVQDIEEIPPNFQFQSFSYWRCFREREGHDAGAAKNVPPLRAVDPNARIVHGLRVGGKTPSPGTQAPW